MKSDVPFALDLTHDNARGEQTAAGFENDLVLILDDARHAQPARQGQPMNLNGLKLVCPRVAD